MFRCYICDSYNKGFSCKECRINTHTYKPKLIEEKVFVSKSKVIKSPEQRKKELNAYYKNKRDTNPLYKLSRIIRNGMRKTLKAKSWHKDSHLKEYIGCSLEFLKEYIEKQFQPGMTWANHTTYGWHLDHIKPLSKAKTSEELYKLCHYTNLQPLWWRDNISKGNR